MQFESVQVCDMILNDVSLKDAVNTSSRTVSDNKNGNLILRSSRDASRRGEGSRSQLVV